MKSKIYTILLFSLLFTIMSIPAFAATSKFDFTMKHRVVNGKQMVNIIHYQVEKGLPFLVQCIRLEGRQTPGLTRFLLN